MKYIKIKLIRKDVTGSTAQVMLSKIKNDISSMNNLKLNRTFMKDEAYDTLCSWIITGELKPNTKLKINELSELLGISRTPVREALLRLERDGLVLTKANSWTIVAPINLIESDNIYIVISTLEALALRQAFPKIKDSDIEQLEILNEKVAKATKEKNYLEIIESDNNFHNKIIELSDNNEIPPILNSLKKRIQRIEIYFFETIQGKRKSYKDHKAIIEGLKERDLEKSLKALSNNWKNNLVEEDYRENK